MPCTPLEHYRLCRPLLQKREESEKIEALLRYPFVQNYQPSIAAAALLSRALGKEFPPVCSLLWPSGAPRAMQREEKRDDCLLPLSIAKELALLWRQLGCVEHEALNSWVSQFQGKSAKRLFYREKSFVEEEATPVKLTVAGDPWLGMSCLATPEFDGALTLSGFNTGLGALHLQGVCISAFGPHTDRLSDTRGFGISHLPAHGSVVCTEPTRAELEGWTRCHGSKESWLHFKSILEKNCATFQVRFYASIPIKMVFYVQARSCRLESQKLEPGSLQSFRGSSQSLCFNDAVRLGCDKEAEMQVIPLAGQGCFWNANFLIAYTCPSNERISFCFSL